MKWLGDLTPHMMLIGRSRIFYNGVLGNSRKHRQMGAILIYVACHEDFQISIEDGPVMRKRVALVPPYTRHQVRCDANLITTILIEPETLPAIEAAKLRARIDEGQGVDQIASQVAAAKAWLRQTRDSSGFTEDDFDDLFFNCNFGKVALDERVALTLNQLEDADPSDSLSASNCARSIDLSTSRFLHLFKEETGQRFRSLRMWKRARRFLHHANEEKNLTYLALDLGYPDSTHFSHSIRRIFGLKPVSIFAGSRNLTVHFGDLQTSGLSGNHVAA